MRRLTVASIAAMAVGLALLFALGAAGAASEQRWVIRTLGTLDGLQSRAVGVNSLGQVIANAEDATRAWAEDLGFGESHAFVWEKGRVTPLGDLGGGGSLAVAINDRGAIVGVSTTATGDRHAFLWRRGHMTDLGTLPGDRISVAVDVNNRGQVAVNSYASRRAETFEQSHAFLWDGGKRRALGALPGAWWSQAVALNERGQVAGVSRPTYKAARRRTSRAFLWDDGRMQALPTPPGKKSWVDGMNDKGHVLGVIEKPPSENGRAVIWRNGRVATIGEWNGPIAWPAWSARINNRDTVVIGSKLWRDGKTLQLGLTHAIAVNERDQVMGYVALEYRKPGDPQWSECYRAALWQNGRIVNLEALGGPGPCTAQRPRAFSDTTAINERGLIVGVSSSHGREHGERAVLWMPAG